MCPGLDTDQRSRCFLHIVHAPQITLDFQLSFVTTSCHATYYGDPLYHVLFPIYQTHSLIHPYEVDRCQLLVLVPVIFELFTEK